MGGSIESGKPGRDTTAVHFLHIRKTGGTAVVDALTPVAQRFHLVLHPHSTKLSDIPRDHRVFFFVRHPIPRFVSGFWSRFRKGRPRHNYEWNEAEREAFSHFQNANDLAEALSASDQKRVFQARAAMRGISHIRSTFTEWFSGEQELDDRLDSIVLVGLQEKLRADFDHLKGLLNLPQTLSLPEDDVRAHRTPPEFDRRLSPLAERNLAEWYAVDIRFYEHCLQVRSQRGL